MCDCNKKKSYDAHEKPYHFFATLTILNTFVCAQDAIYYISFTTSTIFLKENNQNMVNGQRKTKEINLISLTLAR